MAKLIGDIENRVKRLPKPSSIADALQPVFEAISNSIHAIQDRHPNAAKDGQINIQFCNTKDPSTYQIIVADNGIGLEEERYIAFRTADTPFKIQRGGKGVGRLLWLDAFVKTSVVSVFKEAGKLKKRTFDFGFQDDEPIYNEELEVLNSAADLGTIVKMIGLRSNDYSRYMPGRWVDVRKHLGSHFIADFLLGNAPNMTVEFEEDSAAFPDTVEKLLLERRERISFISEQFEELYIDGYIMKPEASADLPGDHQLHLVSSGRTVETRKVDGLLGVKRVGEAGEGVFHACVSGAYLDARVNQERTHFNFDENTAEELTKEVVAEAKDKLIRNEIQEFEEHKLNKLGDFLDIYPSFGFEAPQSLIKKMPANAQSNEQFAKALIPHKIRADNDRRKRVQSVLDRLLANDDIQPDLTEEIRRAAEEASEDQNRQLMEYVVRRKFIIEILQALLGKVRALNGKFDTHLEDTFHQLICPMRVVGGDLARTEPTSHDLWLLDERLAPAVYFASDAPTSDFLGDDGKGRVDLMVWDKIHGLGLGPEDKLERVILVEFKKPERESYKGNYVLMRQMNRYMDKLKKGQVRSHAGDMVELSADVVFHCYVVADLEGDIKADTQSWHNSPSGRGKFDYLKGDFKGTVEVVEWKELLRDAKVRNQNFIEAASLSISRKSEGIFAVAPKTNGHDSGIGKASQSISDDVEASLQ